MRAASPSGGRARDIVAARFRLQYAEGGRWVDVPSGTSPWTTLGRANRSWQGGYTFRFNAVKGRTFRGVAEFEWRRGKRVVRTAARFTSPASHRRLLVVGLRGVGPTGRPGEPGRP